MAAPGLVRVGGLSGMFGGGLVLIWSVVWAFFKDSTLGPPPGYEILSPLLYAVLQILLNLGLLAFSLALVGLYARLTSLPERPTFVDRAGLILALVAAAASVANALSSFAYPGDLGPVTAVAVPSAVLGLFLSALLLGIGAWGSGALGRWRYLPAILAVLTAAFVVAVPAFGYWTLLPGVLAGAGWGFLGYLLLANLEESGRRAAPL